MGGLTINKRHDEESAMKRPIAMERMFFTADGSRLVGEGHPDGVALAIAPGHRLHPDMIKQFGIKNGKLKPSGENKLLKTTSNKGG